MLSIVSSILLATSALALVLPTPISPRGAGTGPYPVPPVSPGCNAKSTSVTGWTVHNFDFHASYIFSTPAHQNSWGYANFTLTNPAVDYAATCGASSDQLSDHAVPSTHTVFHPLQS